MQNIAARSNAAAPLARDQIEVSDDGLHHGTHKMHFVDCVNERMGILACLRIL